MKESLKDAIKDSFKPFSWVFDLNIIKNLYLPIFVIWTFLSIVIVFLLVKIGVSFTDYAVLNMNWVSKESLLGMSETSNYKEDILKLVYSFGFSFLFLFSFAIVFPAYKKIKKENNYQLYMLKDLVFEGFNKNKFVFIEFITFGLISLFLYVILIGSFSFGINDINLTDLLKNVNSIEGVTKEELEKNLKGFLSSLLITFFWIMFLSIFFVIKYLEILKNFLIDKNLSYFLLVKSLFFNVFFNFSIFGGIILVFSFISIFNSIVPLLFGFLIVFLLDGIGEYLIENIKE